MLRLLVLAYLTLSTVTVFAEHIVLLGDSLSCKGQSFGVKVAANYAKTHDDVTIYCADGATPKHYLSGINPMISDENPHGSPCQIFSGNKWKLCGGKGAMPTLDSILKDPKNRGARVIVALGGNSLTDLSDHNDYKKFADKLKNADRSCKWIGPPHYEPANASKKAGFTPDGLAKQDSHLKDFYRGKVGKYISSACQLLDSTSSTKAGAPGYSTADGVHRSLKAGTYWADALASRLLFRRPGRQSSDEDRETATR